MESIRYAALGDSTGVGVGASDGRGYPARLVERIRSRIPKVTLANFCESGATALRVGQKQLEPALTFEPHLATVFIGSNDLMWGDLEAFRAATERISARLAAAGVRTFWCTLPNLAHAPIASQPRFASFRPQIERKGSTMNAHIRNLCQRDRHALVDLYEVGLADFAHFFSADGFHPSATGYEELAARLWEEIRTSLIPS